MTVGIIAALKIEADKIVSSMENPRNETDLSISFVCGKIGNIQVVCSVCGVGKVYSSMCAEAMVLKYSPDYIINTGIAGTLTDKLSIGDMAIASSVCQHDFDTTAFGNESGFIDGIGKVYLNTSEFLVKRFSEIAVSKNITVQIGTIASGDQFIGSFEKKKYIKDTFSAIACEMEGGAVGQVCTINKVPFCVIRAISDDADGNAAEDYPFFAKNSAEKSADMVIEFIRSL